MSDWDELTDDELLAALGEAVASPSSDVADRRRAAAQVAFTWHTVDAELAELLHDSALDAGAAVRSGSEGPRALSFGRSGLTLEVEVTGSEVLGEVIAEGAAADLGVTATVTLQRPDTEDVVVAVDAAGFFRISDIAAGPVRFVVERAGWSMTTPWVTL